MAVLVRAQRVLWRTTAAGVVLLPLDADEPFLLAGSGAALWDLLAEPVELEDAVDLLAEAHAVDRDVVASSVAPVVKDLIQRRAVDQLT